MKAEPGQEGKSELQACVRCGCATEHVFGGVPVCDECYVTRGSCCPEFGEDDLTDPEV